LKQKTSKNKSLKQIAKDLQHATGTGPYESLPLRVIRKSSSIAEACEELEAYKELINHALGWLYAEASEQGINKKELERQMEEIRGSDFGKKG
jgi:hypothetical protein